MVLVKLVVELLKSLVVAMGTVQVQVGVVYLGYVDRHKGHELAEDTHTSMPEGGLGKAAGQAP